MARKGSIATWILAHAALGHNETLDRFTPATAWQGHDQAAERLRAKSLVADGARILRTRRIADVDVSALIGDGPRRL